MKRLLIISDTHGRLNRSIDIITAAENLSGIIHAGDTSADAEDLAAAFPDIPVYYVSGNSEIFPRAPLSLNLEIGRKRIFVTHGHMERVKNESGLTTLKSAAGDAELVIFGHTHKARTEYSGKTTILNPGSITFSRTYAEVVIDGDRIKTEIKEI